MSINDTFAKFLCFGIGLAYFDPILMKNIRLICNDYLISLRPDAYNIFLLTISYMFRPNNFIMELYYKNMKEIK
jgi:hypothetical protein